MTRAILVPTNALPREIEIDGLHDLQATVGGLIESAPFVFDESIAVYINDEGKFTCKPNRAIYAPDGTLLDIIFGDFVCTGDNGEGGDIDLTDEQVEISKRRFGKSTVGSGTMAALKIISYGHQA